MSEPSAPPPSADLLGQLFSAKPPETVDDMRRLLDGFGALINAGAPEVGALHEEVVVRESDGGRVTADVVVPKGEGPHPVLVYLHGGGWICGSPRTHRKLACRFAEAGHLVFNVDYRLAPEAPFPTPLEDSIEAIRFAAREAPRYGGDPNRLAVGGDSAGGNLTAAAAAALADAPDAPPISAVLLVYGVFDFAALDGAELPAATPALPGDLAQAGEKLVELMVGSYLGAERSEALLADPRVSPLHAAHKLPPAHVVVGTADPLVAQAESLVARLREAGVEHEHVVVPDMPHGFVQMEFFPQARESIDRMVTFLRKHVGG
jgi:acetyl esterase